MSFCTNCGISLESNVLNTVFCHNCGTKLELINEQKAKSAFPLPPKNSPSVNIEDFIINESFKSEAPELHSFDNKRIENFAEGFSCNGIIFTDSRKIAKRCRSTSNEIFNILKNYSNSLKKYGYQYIIFDFDSSRHKSIDWKFYVNELNSFYNNQKIKPKFLFIIGDNDIIPMPVFENHLDLSIPDFDYDTDIPYAYLQSEDIIEKSWDGSLYYDDIKLHVGRLPFGTDFSKNHLTNYFNKVITAFENGFKIQNCFGLSAESWQEASETVLSGLNISNKFIDFSPTVSLTDIDEIFDITSDILYFNLHGSDAPEQPQFFGDRGLSAISPNQISQLIKNNIIITEACYGGKFIDYSSSTSMLLNSIHKNTLGFVGSSRIAFGSSSDQLFSADIIAYSILNSLSNNLSLGEAMSKARIDNIEATYGDDNISLRDYSLITAIEFNLFGDPMVKPFNNSIDNSNSIDSYRITSNLLFSKNKESLYQKSSNHNILEEVRTAVDYEFDIISKVIQKELFDRFQLTFNDLLKIEHYKSNVSEEFLYVYKKQLENISKEKIFLINFTKSGKLKNVITSK
jgi:hypothetical protein